ncbi:MAG: SUF system Fe-S cluster assembly regulator [Acidobacteria bacterium]|nr:SUF system Fe-S cluster assembly regulator [Acidobacteriota bacterium]
MLKLTKKADYGLIALKHLAVNASRGPASAKEIAANYRLPVPLLSKILQSLSRGGFVVSEHGTNGGYRLARDPRQITCLEVVRSIDGPIILTACFTDHGECSQSELCTVREPLRRVHESILRLLESITIATLVDDEPVASGCATPPPEALTSLAGLAVIRT